MEETPEITESLETLLADLHNHCLDGNFDRLEAVWFQAIETAPEQVGSCLESFLKAGEGFLDDDKKLDRLGALLELLLSCLGDDAPPRQTLRLYWLLIYCLPEKVEYQTEFSQRFEQLYPLASAERAFYDSCGFTTGLDPVAALQRLERLLRFREGAFVYHASGWGVGKVVAVDPFLKQIKVDLEAKPQHRISIDVVDSILEPLESDSFRALLHQGGDELGRLRDEDPVKLIRVLFEAIGSPAPVKDIKAQLVPRVVPADLWARWWNKTKGKLRQTGHFRVGDRSPHLVEQLEQAVCYEDELIEQFERSDWSQAKQIARQVSRRTGGSFSTAWSRIRERLQRMCEEASASRAVEAGLILSRGDGESGGEVLKKVVSAMSAEEVVSAFEGMPAADDQRRAAEALPELRPDDWQEVTIRLLHGKRDILRQVALDTLERKAPETLDRLVRELVAAPHSSPQAFCYALSCYQADSSRPVLEAFREKCARDLLVLVLDLLEHLHHRGPRRGSGSVKSIVEKIQTILDKDSYRLFREGLGAMELKELRDVHDRLVRNSALPVHFKGALLDLIARAAPSLLQPSRKPWEEESITYVTSGGLDRRRREFRELTDVKIPRNAEDIGRAMEFGDLSENAEYTAALEEQKKLTERAEAMRAELEHARVIEPDSVSVENVGLGSRIRLRNTSTSEEVVYSVLGPWDGSPEEGVVSYRSPLGRFFLGKRVGDVVQVELPGGSETYELLEIRNCFEAGD